MTKFDRECILGLGLEVQVHNFFNVLLICYFTKYLRPRRLAIYLILGNEEAIYLLVMVRFLCIL